MTTTLAAPMKVAADALGTAALILAEIHEDGVTFSVREAGATTPAASVETAAALLYPAEPIEHQLWQAARILRDLSTKITIQRAIDRNAAEG